MEDLKECYAVLEIPVGAAWEEIQRAHRELVKVWHPDRFVSDRRLQKRAERRLQEINQAYARLEAMHATWCASAPADPQAGTEKTEDANRGFRRPYWSPPLYRHRLQTVWLRSPLLATFGAVATLVLGFFLLRFLQALHIGAFSTLESASHGMVQIPNSPELPNPINLTAISHLVRGRGNVDCPECPPEPNPGANLGGAARISAPQARMNRRRTPAGRPPNGWEFIDPQGPSGEGNIEILNRRDEDIIADIWKWDTEKRIVRSVYIRLISRNRRIWHIRCSDDFRAENRIEPCFGWAATG